MKKIILKGMFLLISFLGMNLDASAYVVECRAEYNMEVYGEGRVEVMPTVRVTDWRGHMVNENVVCFEEMEGRVIFTFFVKGDYYMEISAIGYKPQTVYFAVIEEGDAVGEVNILGAITLEKWGLSSIQWNYLDKSEWNLKIRVQQVERMSAKENEIELFVV